MGLDNSTTDAFVKDLNTLALTAIKTIGEERNLDSHEITMVIGRMIELLFHATPGEYHGDMWGVIDGGIECIKDDLKAKHKEKQDNLH